MRLFAAAAGRARLLPQSRLSGSRPRWYPSDPGIRAAAWRARHPTPTEGRAPNRYADPPATQPWRDSRCRASPKPASPVGGVLLSGPLERAEAPWKGDRWPRRDKTMLCWPRAVHGSATEGTAEPRRGTSTRRAGRKPKLRPRVCRPAEQHVRRAARDEVDRGELRTCPQTSQA